MINAVESSQEGARSLPHVFKHQPVRNTCIVRYKKFASIIDDKRRLGLKMDILSQLEYLARTRKNAKVRDGRVQAEFHKLTEKYWSDLTSKHRETIRMALNELEEEGLIERTAAFDVLGAPTYARLKHGYPDRSRRIALNTEVIEERMLERVSELRPTSTDSLTRPVWAEIRPREDGILCVQEIPKSLSSERDLSTFSGECAVSTPARKKRKGSREDIWVLSQPCPVNDWFRRLQKVPVLVAALMAVGFKQITAAQARMWLRHMIAMTTDQREEIFCEIATTQRTKARDMKTLIKWIKRKREDLGCGGVSTLVEQPSTEALVRQQASALRQSPLCMSPMQSLINTTLTMLQCKDSNTKTILAAISRGYLPVFDMVTGEDFGLLIPFRAPTKIRTHALAHN